MKKKGQIMILDVLFFALCAIFILYFEILFFEDIKDAQLETEEETQKLKSLLFVDKLVSDCNYFAKSANNYVSLCYQNVLELKILQIEGELKENKICKIRLGEAIVYQKEITEIEMTITRGVVLNNEFKIMEFYKCK